MPKLLGYRERTNTTVWDAFSPTIWRSGAIPHGLASGLLPTDPPHVRLFGNSNIGQSHLSNMQVPCSMAKDTEFLILNWYARTNIHDALQAGRPDASPFARAWYAWANATIASIVVGCMPVIQTPLAELLGPLGEHSRIGGRTYEVCETVIAAARELLAQRMYEAYTTSRGPGGIFDDIGPTSPWSDMSHIDREHWLAAADAANPIRIPIIVPVRQNFHVTIETNRQALQAMQEVMPRDIAPQALVWVHLEGVTSREVQ